MNVHLPDHRAAPTAHADVARTVRCLSTYRVEVPFSAHFHSARSGRNPDGTWVEGLRTAREGGDDAPGGAERGPLGPVSGPEPTFEHQPVMLDEVVETLRVAPGGVLVDATVGGAGHSAAILDAAPQLRLVALDQDPDAVRVARRRLARFGARAEVVRARFDALPEVLAARHVETVSAALLDLGVSSPQLDRAERGFSYRHDAPLDMRMDPDRPTTAATVVNSWPEARIAQILADNGEVRFAGRIASAIVAARPLRTTLELADVVRGAIPAAARRHGGHPARRSFQAVRLAVNEELEVLGVALDALVARLAPGGRLAVLSYHSGEDRLVKSRLRSAASGGCTCPPGLPCVCGARPTLRLLTRGARRPSVAEVEANRRAESARLRAAEGTER